MPTIRRLSFIGLEYAFAPEKGLRHVARRRLQTPRRAVEIETDQGVKGIGERSAIRSSRANTSA